MLFRVAVVSQEDYDEQMQLLRDAGQTGALGEDLNKLNADGEREGVR
jgi:cytochrome c oxidase subunit 2